MPNLFIATVLLPCLLTGGDGSNGKTVMSGDNKDVIVKRSIEAGSSATGLCEVPPSLHYHCDCKVKIIIIYIRCFSSWLVCSST